MKIASEGYPFIIGSLIPGMILTGFQGYHQSWFLTIPGIGLLLFGIFCLLFFRSPRRVIPDEDGILVSPADGKVLHVIEIDDEFVGRGHRVDIFLSVLDVHLNRIPASGEIKFVKYRPGKFFSAFRDKASEDNERTDIGIAGENGNFRVVQIAGSIARRIVCRIKENDSVDTGQLYGLIRFGSRTELSFPGNYTPCVKPGQHVKGGVTIVGRLGHNA